MANKTEKLTRNEEIYTRRQKEGWTFEKLAQYYNLSRPTLHQIYHREKKRREETVDNPID